MNKNIFIKKLREKVSQFSSYVTYPYGLYKTHIVFGIIYSEIQRTSVLFQR